MATKIAMPKLSDTMEEGIILKWLKKEGESVKQGEIIAEVQTDKADMELEAYDTGVLRKIFVPEGKGAAVGKPIAIIGSASEDISSLLVDTAAQVRSMVRRRVHPCVKTGRTNAAFGYDFTRFGRRR